MGLQVLKKSKFFCLAMALLMMLGMFVTAGASVYASET
ncbi:TPA: streptococcin A-M57, partial [Enterococcus faecalis]|nr:streptococcin A-M57 [Enterococcus faecalis]HBI1566101.1 streptococcin A-M57 [Enterococcus faecalis]HBI1770378.1 streptococcin A-M57 [Enterococcus faecalis]